MAELQIPANQTRALQAFVQLSTDLSKTLISALNEARPALTPARLARQVAKQVNIPLPEIREILQLIGSLLIAAGASKKSKEFLASSVAKTLSEEKLLGKELAEDEIEAFKNKLLNFMSLRVLEITAKATDVMLQHKNVFVDARVLTDLRPVFAEDDLSPVAGLVIHNLEIQTYTDSSPVSYFFALDSSDIRKLQTVIERSIHKEQAMRTTIDRSGLFYLETEDES
jgi:hypothetical protein